MVRTFNSGSRTKLPLVEYWHHQDEEIKDYDIFHPKRGRETKRYEEILTTIGENKAELCYQKELIKLYKKKYNENGFSQAFFAECLENLRKWEFIQPFENKITTEYYKNGKKVTCYRITIKSLIALSHRDDFNIHQVLKNHKPDVSNGLFLNNFYLDIIAKIPEKILRNMLNYISRYYNEFGEWYSINFTTNTISQNNLNVDSISLRFQRTVINKAFSLVIFQKPKFQSPVSLFSNKELVECIMDNKKEILTELEKEEWELERQLDVVQTFTKILKNKPKFDNGSMHDYKVLCDKMIAVQTMKLKNESLIDEHAKHKVGSKDEEIGKNLSELDKRKLIEEIISEKKIYDVERDLDLIDIVNKYTQVDQENL